MCRFGEITQIAPVGSMGSFAQWVVSRFRSVCARKRRPLRPPAKEG